MKHATVVIALALAGCASPAPQKWVQADGGSGFQRDLAQCEYEASVLQADPALRTVTGQAFSEFARQERAKTMCMRAKGWERQR